MNNSKAITRLDRFKELAEKHALDLQDFGLDDYIGCGPDESDIPEYCAFEIAADGTGSDYAPWAYIAETLTDLGDDLTDSETSRESVAAYDLNTGLELTVETKVTVTL